MPFTATFLPTADGTVYTTWAVGAGPANKWDCVNDDPNDGDTSYVFRAAAATGYQGFVSAFGSLTGTLIITVNHYAWLKLSALPATVCGAQFARLNGVDRVCATFNVTTAWVEYTYDISALRPGGGSWNPADFITGPFEWGVGKQVGSVGVLSCTQTRLVITYQYVGGFSSFITSLLPPLVGAAGLIGREVRNLLARSGITATPDEIRRIREVCANPGRFRLGHC